MVPLGAATIWVDVEDFFAYFEANPRPSGIQRLAFEIKLALQELIGTAGRLRFVRTGTGAALLREVSWTEVKARFETPGGGAPAAPAVVRRRRRGPGWLRRWVHELPENLRNSLFRIRVLQGHAVRSFCALAGVHHAPPDLVPEAVKLDPAKPEPAVVESVDAIVAPDPFADLVHPGDCFLVLGAPWAVPGFARRLAALKRRYGMTVSLLLYDLVPARHPEWCTPGLVAEFDSWLDATLPLCDRLMAISRHTARDVEAYARERRITLAGPVEAIPIGTGFSDGAVKQAPAPGLPQPGSYVLFVSTLEARKNHALAINVWRRLAEDVRCGRRAWLPDLVFAGRVGWLVADQLQQLENTAWLRGRVRLLQDPSDAELRALYAGCLFTLFPSLFEGWGLPVTESLAAGKPCLCSNAAALPEAGGAVSRYFDPRDVGAAYRAVAAVLDDRAGLRLWEEQVRREFQPTPWTDTARAVLACMPGSPQPARAVAP